MNSYYLNIDSAGRLMLSFPDGGKVQINSLEQLSGYAANIDATGLPLMCSSSLDFPDELTDDPHVIAMCDAIRGGGARP